jgi:hypothetical protein
MDSGDFIQHDVSGGSKRCWVNDMLVHTDPGQDMPVIIIADGRNKELRTFDLSSWQCVSQCTMPATPTRCLYESDGAAYLYCGYGSLYHILSAQPLTISTSPHGRVTWEEGEYTCVSHLGPGRLVAVSPDPPAVHVINIHGRQLADSTTCGEYRFTEPHRVVCAGRRVVVSGEGEGRCLGRELDNGERVVCLEESAGSWSVQWMHDVVSGYPLTPVISPGGGTVIVPCNGSGGSIVSLSLETGAIVQQVDVSPGCPTKGWGNCIYGGRLLVGCEGAGVVVEFSIQDKMVCHHVVLLLLLFCRGNKLLKHQSL